MWGRSCLHSAVAVVPVDVMHARTWPLQSLETERLTNDLIGPNRPGSMHRISSSIVPAVRRTGCEDWLVAWAGRARAPPPSARVHVPAARQCATSRRSTSSLNPRPAPTAVNVMVRPIGIWKGLRPGPAIYLSLGWASFQIEAGDRAGPYIWAPTSHKFIVL